MARPINDLEVLQHRVENACQERQEAGVKAGIFVRVRTSVRRRAGTSVEMHGNHTEHLLQPSYEHRPYLNRHWFLDICLLGFFAHLSEYYIPHKTYNPFF
jgi:hypothetical protein